MLALRASSSLMPWGFELGPFGPVETADCVPNHVGFSNSAALTDDASATLSGAFSIRVSDRRDGRRLETFTNSDILALATHRNLRSPSHERSIRLMEEQFIHFRFGLRARGQSVKVCFE
jgi:hypothetical protein